MAEWILFIVITKVAQNVQCLLAHHSSIALSMTLWSTTAAKRAVNAAITL